MEITIIIICTIAVLIIFCYNKLIRKKNGVDNALGSVNAMLKNRYDLIPNLVDTVKAYMTYETDVLNKLTSMRTMVINENIPETDKLKLDKDIAGEIKKIMISVENYPELRTSSSFLQLQESWTDIEDRISASRRFYNHAVTEYNNSINSFPQNIVANMMGYKSKIVFQVSEQEKQNIKAKGLF